MSQSQLKGYKGRGVVLHTLKYGENSMIVQLLTDGGGRQSFIVHGVRSGRGRGSKAALFQPFFAVEFEGMSSSRGELHRFREVRSGITLRCTPFDLRRSTVALFIAEVLYRLVRESAPNEELFDFVWRCVEALDGVKDGAQVANFHLWFLVQLSPLLGFTPSGEYREGCYFDIVEGVFTPFMPSHATVLDPLQSGLLHQFLGCDARQAGDVALSGGRRGEFLEAVISYYNYHLDMINHVQSLQILREIF
ncbi:MAG: DNA repair protein RecO [Rikenellaceae bacterium]